MKKLLLFCSKLDLIIYRVVFIYQTLAVFVLGHALAEVGRVPGGTKEESDIGISKINKERYSHTMKAYSKKSSSNYDKWFKFGVETLIDGLEVLLKKRSEFNIYHS